MKGRMARLLSGACLILWAGTALAQGPGGLPHSAPDPAARISALRAAAGIAIPAACCKICRKGRACGDSCISRDRACHAGPGCACNG